MGPRIRPLTRGHRGDRSGTGSTSRVLAARAIRAWAGAHPAAPVTKHVDGARVRAEVARSRGERTRLGGASSPPSSLETQRPGEAAASAAAGLSPAIATRTGASGSAVAMTSLGGAPAAWARRLRGPLRLLRRRRWPLPEASLPPASLRPSGEWRPSPASPSEPLEDGVDPTSQLRTQKRIQYQRTLGESDSGRRRPVETMSLLPWPGSGTASQRTAGIAAMS
jgi:hypothetical protein